MWIFEFCCNVVRFQDWILRRKRFQPTKKTTSKGERAVAAALKKHGIPYESQYELGYYVHADFAIHLNGVTCIIEYDGRQHFHPVKFFGGRWRFFLQRLRDILENAECKSRNMPLLRIKYTLPLEQVEGVVIDFLRKNTQETTL